jgi:hypothetical protein
MRINKNMEKYQKNYIRKAMAKAVATGLVGLVLTFGLASKLDSEETRTNVCAAGMGLSCLAGYVSLIRSSRHYSE